MKLTHFGHACLLLETDGGARLLLDPGTLSPGFDDLRDLTAVLITHEHPDHVDAARLTVLLAQNPDAVLLIDQTVAPAVGHLSPRVVHAGDSVELPGALVQVLGGRHEPIVDDFPGTGNVGYLIDDFYHPGDAWDVPPTPVDVLALPIGGPWVKFADAIAYMRAVTPRVAVPMHEAQLASTGQADDMLPMFAPDGTTYLPLEHGVATEL